MSGLLNTAAIDGLIRGVVPWEGIARNLAAGRLRSAGVIATELATGKAVVFVEGRGVDPALWAHDRSVVARAARLGAEHVLASAAIPLLFPAVRVGDGYYVDGALRLNTPLAPAIHLGADRMLVVALRSEEPEPADEGAARSLPRSGFSAVLGRVLGALLLDRLETDLGRMQFMNRVLERGTGVFGSDFLARLNQDGERKLRRIESLVIRPSQSLGGIAREIARARRSAGRLPRKVRLFLDLAVNSDAGSDSDLLSLLLFDPEYFQVLMELGWADARARQEELAAFFAR
jgi:NTE family protein